MIPEGVVHGTTSPPTRLDVAMWVANVMAEMKREGGIIWNAWRKKGYEWFVGNAMNNLINTIYVFITLN
jgi:hypothetical protein